MKILRPTHLFWNAVAHFDQSTHNEFVGFPRFQNCCSQVFGTSILGSAGTAVVVAPTLYYPALYYGYSGCGC